MPIQCFVQHQVLFGPSINMRMTALKILINNSAWENGKPLNRSGLKIENRENSENPMRLIKQTTELRNKNFIDS